MRNPGSSDFDRPPVYGIDDVAPSVEALERPRGRHVEADVGFVVVLDNELAVVLREFEQRALARERHRDGGGKLVARGHEQALAALGVAVHDETLPVNREPQHVDALDAGHVDDIRIARILDPESVAR